MGRASAPNADILQKWRLENSLVTGRVLDINGFNIFA